MGTEAFNVCVARKFCNVKIENQFIDAAFGVKLCAVELGKFAGKYRAGVFEWIHREGVFNICSA